MLISGDGVETTLNHYFEFAESDGDTISGIAVRYGDRYETDYANYEFVHGAFGDVKSVDAIANVQHRRDKPLARTGGGLVFSESVTELSVTLKMPNTALARDTHELIRNKVLTGFSIECMLEDWNADTGLITKAELLGVAVVDRGAFKDSKIQKYQLGINQSRPRDRLRLMYGC